MKILWFPRLQLDIDTLHITTWREMCRELEGMGCEVRIAIAGKDSNNIFDRDYIRIFLIRKKYLRILTFWIFGFIKFVYAYFAFKPNVVILDISSTWFSLPFVIISRWKVLFIVDNRTPNYDETSNKSSMRDRVMKFYTNLSHWYSRHFLNGMTVITSYYKEQVCRRFGFPLSSIGVWGSGVDTSVFLPQKHASDIKPSFLKGKFIVMQHGYMSYNRGLLETIEAISRIDNEDIVLLLIGDGKVKPEILRKIERRGLEKKVYVLPPVPYSEIPTYIGYSNCAIMAYPNIEYWNNNNPIKLLEYLAMGKVVICTDMWTFKAVCGESKCACYLEDNDPETIKDAISYCYQNRSSLVNWGAEGIDIVRERFTWRKQAERLINFIDSLRKERARHM